MKVEKLAVVGSRFLIKKEGDQEIADKAQAALIGILNRFHNKYKPSWYVSGGAQGVDEWGEDWSKTKSMSRQIFVPVWYPDGKYDKGAGFKRNALIIQNADFVIALTNGSNGTKNSIDWAKRLKKPLVVFNEEGKVVEKENIPDD